MDKAAKLGHLRNQRLKTHQQAVRTRHLALQWSFFVDNGVTKDRESASCIYHHLSKNVRYRA
ncbi:Uncharacterised protein [Vibrio cholerae]|nr:Uncharacterised protein [Vibrio cholerae]